MRNSFGSVDRVDYFGGATFATNELSDNIDGVGIYPDTSLSEQKDAWYPINPSAKAYWDTSVPWDKSIFKELPLDTLSIYILKKETYDSQNWENIRDDYMIQQRYDLSIYDLQKLNYTLYYPPTEAMRDMKMWPRYGE